MLLFLNYFLKVKMNRQTAFTYRLLSMLDRCRRTSNWDLALHLIKKYCIDKEKLKENYYD